MDASEEYITEIEQSSASSTSSHEDQLISTQLRHSPISTNGSRLPVNPKDRYDRELCLMQRSLSDEDLPVASRLRRRTSLHGLADPAPRAVNVSKFSVPKSSVSKSSVSKSLVPTPVPVSVPTSMTSSTTFEGFPPPVTSLSNTTLTDAVTVTAPSIPLRIPVSEQAMSYPVSPNVRVIPVQSRPSVHFRSPLSRPQSCSSYNDSDPVPGPVPVPVPVPVPDPIPVSESMENPYALPRPLSVRPRSPVRRTPVAVPPSLSSRPAYLPTRPSSHFSSRTGQNASSQSIPNRVRPVTSHLSASDDAQSSIPVLVSSTTAFDGDQRYSGNPPQASTVPSDYVFEREAYYPSHDFPRFHSSNHFRSYGHSDPFADAFYYQTSQIPESQFSHSGNVPPFSGNVPPFPGNVPSSSDHPGSSNSRFPSSQRYDNNDNYRNNPTPVARYRNDNDFEERMLKPKDVEKLLLSDLTGVDCTTRLGIFFTNIERCARTSEGRTDIARSRVDARIAVLLETARKRGLYTDWDSLKEYIKQEFQAESTFDHEWRRIVDCAYKYTDSPTDYIYQLKLDYSAVQDRFPHEVLPKRDRFLKRKILAGFPSRDKEYLSTFLDDNVPLRRFLTQVEHQRAILMRQNDNINGRIVDLVDNRNQNHEVKVLNDRVRKLEDRAESQAVKSPNVSSVEPSPYNSNPSPPVLSDPVNSYPNTQSSPNQVPPVSYNPPISRGSEQPLNSPIPGHGAPLPSSGPYPYPVSYPPQFPYMNATPLYGQGRYWQPRPRPPLYAQYYPSPPSYNEIGAREKYCAYCRVPGHTLRECVHRPPLGCCFECGARGCYRGSPHCPGRRRPVITPQGDKDQGPPLKALPQSSVAEPPLTSTA